MSKKTFNIEETLRQAVIESEFSVYRLAKMSGVSQPSLCRFVNRQRHLTLPAAAKLAATLGLELLKPNQKSR